MNEVKRVSAKQVKEQVDSLSMKLDDVVGSSNDALEAMDKKIDEKFEDLNNNILILIRKFSQPEVNSEESEIGKAEAVEFTTDNRVISKGLENVNSPEFKKKAEKIAFYNEPVTVMIHTVNDKYALKTFAIYVDGRPEFFTRGQQKTVKRYYVEGLARCKPLHFGNEEYIDSDGIQKVRHPVTLGLEYPFAVVEDKNPVGKAWLDAVLRQP